MIRSNAGIILVMCILMITLTCLTDNFMRFNNIISVLRQISNNVFLSLGMTLVIILGGIDLSVGAVVALSGTVTVGLIVRSGCPMPVAILCGLGLGVLIGLINGGIIAGFHVPAFIVTLATMNIAKGVTYIYTGGQSARITDESFAMIGTGYIFGIIPLPVLYMIILIVLFTVILGRTKFGTYVYAVGGNAESARLSGVPIKKVKILVFTLSGLLSAFSGIVLAARMYSGQPNAGDGYEMDAIAACVLGGVSMAGGVGHISGTLFGAVVIGIISNGLNLMRVSSFWQLVVKGVIILAAIILDAKKDTISSYFKNRRRKTDGVF